MPTPFDPAFQISNLFQKAKPLDMRVYISEQEKFSDCNSEGVFIWHETNIPYAVWGPQSTRSLSWKHYPYEALKHNGSLYAQVSFATSEDAWNESLGSGTEIRLRLSEETDGKIYPILIAKHDVMDWTCTRRWLNLPVGLSMEHEIYKSANTLRSYYQIGGKLMDFIIALHGSKAVKTFCSRMHFSLGAGCSATEGLVGRVLEVDLQAGDGGSADTCYTYSYSECALVAVSLEGNIVATMWGWISLNSSYYTWLRDQKSREISGFKRAYSVQ